MEGLQIREAPSWLTASSKPWKQAGPGTVHGPAAGRKGAGGVVPGLMFVKREKVEGHSDGSAYNTCFDSTHLGNSIVIFPGRDICQTITFSLIPSSHGKATGRKSPWQARTSVCARAQTATRRQARCSARHARSREWPASSAATTASSATGYVSVALPE